MKIGKKIIQIVLIIILLFGNIAFANENKTSEDFIPKDAYETKSLRNGINAYRVGRYWGLYNSREILVTPMYDYIEAGDTYIHVQQNGYWGALSYSGLVVANAMWDSITELPNSALRIERNGLFGWVSNNKMQVPMYQQVEYAGKKMFGVCDNKGCGVVHESNTVLIPLTHKETFSYLSEGYFKLTYNGMVGLADMFGNTLLNCICLDNVEKADKNAIYVVNSANKYKGLLRAYDGKRIAPTKYTNIVEIKEQPGYFKVKYNGKWGAVDYDGNNVFMPNYGPLEINRMIKNLPANKKFKNQYDYNKDYQTLGKACFEFYGYLYLSFNSKSHLKELLNNTNTSEKIRTMLLDFLKKNNLSL